MPIFKPPVTENKTAPGPMVLVSAVMAVAILAGGALYFRRMEKRFADVV